MSTHLQTNAIARFACLGAECPDTCCQGWAMQVTAETVEKYRHEALELLDTVMATDAGVVMRRDPATDICVKFDQGWCAVHRDYGEEFLGDACHFFPRITRALGETVITSAALSCPEAARQMLYTPYGLAFANRETIRTPYSLKNYLPAGMTPDDALAIHGIFLSMAGDESASAERGLMRISTVARALERQPMTAWSEAAAFYATMADASIPQAETHAADLFNLLHALYGLVKATPNPRARLMNIINSMAGALGVVFDGSGRMQLAGDALQRSRLVAARMCDYTELLQPVLRNYLAAQISQALFPFAGLGDTLGERVTIIGVRFATIKLALAAQPELPSAEKVVEIIQILSRFCDHLADATLSLKIYSETGWVRESRLRAIVGG